MKVVTFTSTGRDMFTFDCQDSCELSLSSTGCVHDRIFPQGKRFEIYPEDQPSSRKLIYFTGSRSRSKYLLRLLRDTHSLYMSLSPFVDHMREVDGKTGESFISLRNSLLLDPRPAGFVYSLIVTKNS